MSIIYADVKKNKLSKKYRKERCSEIITSYAVGVRFTDADVDELKSLIEVQFKSAMRRVNSTFPKDPAHLWILDDEGIAPRWRSCSWNKCISPETDRQARYTAMRKAIWPEIEAQRGILDQECKNCGALENLQVDHKTNAFKKIADKFIDDDGMFEIVNNDKGSSWAFGKMESEAKWLAFHKSQADYQMLCGLCNASKGAK